MNMKLKNKTNKLINFLYSIAGISVHAIPANTEIKNPTLSKLILPDTHRIFEDIDLIALYTYSDATHEALLPSVLSINKKPHTLFEYIERFVDHFCPLTDNERYILEYKHTLFASLKLQFNPHDTTDFILKSQYLAKVWELFYICPLAPETFCFIFALYNVVKAAGLYYYYTQHTKEISHVLTPILHRTISKVMLGTLLPQVGFILLLFINPVIFDRVLVMCSGLLMSHGFISIFKVSGVALFAVIINYIFHYSSFLKFIFAVETYCLISFMVLFCLLLFASNNLVFTLVLFEAIFFCLIPLMCAAYVQTNKNWDFKYNFVINKNTYKDLLKYYIPKTTNTVQYPSLAVYSSIQYFLYNAFFLGVYIFALTLLFFYSRSFSYFELYSMLLQSQSYGYSNVLVFIFFCIVSMVCFKMGIVPYHGWMLAVFSNINIIPLMLLLLPFKLAIFSTGMRLFYGVLHPYLFLLQPFLFVMAILSMLFGAFGMFLQMNIREFLLYSTINHSGYILIGLSSGTVLGIKATVFYVMIYMITTLGFLIFISTTISEKTKKPFTNFTELASVANLTSFPFIVFCVILLSMAGIPPFAGFWVKLFIIDALIGFGYLGWFVILIIILTSTITVVGYLRVIKLLFLEPRNLTTTIIIKNYTLYSLRVLFFVFFFLLFFGFFYLLYYYIFRDIDLLKVYAFFRLVL